MKEHDRGTKQYDVKANAKNFGKHVLHLTFQSHVEKCEHALTNCTNSCGAEFEKRFLEKHMKEDCPRRSITCDFCMTKVSSKWIQ